MSNVLKIKHRLVFESTSNVENEVDELETGGCAQTTTLRLMQGGASMRGACLRNTGGTEAVSCESRSNSRFGVSWDPVDEEAMLGNVMGIPAPAWPLGITLEAVGSMLKDQNMLCYKKN
ncbi:hypothetical protein Tco_1093073 [Tanacetum coccineum]|uniref:Uncharacterized protein n=1 Tax=Tanacetum coccineum TaxID=301880 RepID=A0ABQ5IC12_9ASTR